MGSDQGRDDPDQARTVDRQSSWIKESVVGSGDTTPIEHSGMRASAMNSSDNGNPKNQTPGKTTSRRGGARPGAGRKKGSVEPQTLAIREIARSITLGNPRVVARLNREAELGTINPSVLINLIDRGWGRPIPMEEEAKPAAPTLVFGTLHGYVPWDRRIPAARAMDERSARMNAAKAEELKMQAIESGKDPVVIEAGAADAKAKSATADKADEGDGEQLEVVRLPEPPEPFNPRGR